MTKGVYPRISEAARFAGGWIPEPNTGCHIWTRAVNVDGYGKFSIQNGEQRRHLGAHVFAWEQEFGPVPRGLVLDHARCDTPTCCNPHHLKAVTVRENTMRGRSPSARNAVAEECVHGHAFTVSNTRRETDGSRSCRECNRLKARRMRAK